MAERMLSGDIKEGDSVIIDVDADGQVRAFVDLQDAPLVLQHLRFVSWLWEWLPASWLAKGQG